MMPSTYTAAQATCLFTPYQGPLMDLDSKEQALREGAYYGDLLSREDLPSAPYLAIFDRQLRLLADRLAPHVLRLAGMIDRARPTGVPLALLSIARAGTPIGVVLTEVLRARYGRQVTHYSVSVIHHYGLDEHALAHVLDRHAPASLVFLDGWVSQGRITRTLEASLSDRPDIDSTLYCLSDPSGIQDATATREDLLLPSAVLNAAVSGLLSRTVHCPDAFDACVFYDDQRAVDRTQAFILALQDAVARCARADDAPLLARGAQRPLALAQVSAWCAAHDTQPAHIKAGIGEVSRSLLRRSPRFVHVDPSAEAEAEHLVFLAQERNVPLDFRPLSGPFRAFSLLD